MSTTNNPPQLCTYRGFNRVAEQLLQCIGKLDVIVESAFEAAVLSLSTDSVLPLAPADRFPDAKRTTGCSLDLRLYRVDKTGATSAAV